MFEQELEFDAISPLLAALCDGTIDDERFAHLERLLAANPTARQWYLAYMDLHGELCWDHRRNDERGMTNDEREHPDFLPDPAIHRSSFTIHPSPTIHYPLSTIHSLLFSYAIAAVIVGAGLLIGSVMHVSRPMQVARQSAPIGASNPQSLTPNPSPKAPLVGRITGMVDCRWERSVASGQWPVASKSEMPSLTTSHWPLATNHLVSLGDRFTLASGLMEITYNSGAKVILQGPVTYEVESASGGFLSLGKLTARVEKKVASGQWPVASKSEMSSLTTSHWPLSTNTNPQSLIPDPSSLSTIHYPLFTVRTPTALVTDLGTEFGVEVDKRGGTTSHVFRGSVEFQLSSVGAAKNGDPIVLRESETARTESSSGAAGPTVSIRRVSADPQVFVRRIAQAVKTLDLLDIVAGGYGITKLREHGLDASTGMQDPVLVTLERPGDGKYRPVTWHKLIDGTFVPDGRNGPVVLDSSGHTFDGFPRTAGEVYGSIWARPADFKSFDDRTKDGNYWIYFMGRREEYMPERRGLLGLHPNAGITFNLAAMRDIYRGARPTRFHAVAGLADAQSVSLHPNGLADIWVFVDGQLKLKRMHLRPEDGVVRVDVAIGPDDRFLTLVSTDGGGSSADDWVVFGDPVLDMIPAEEDRL